MNQNDAFHGLHPWLIPPLPRERARKEIAAGLVFSDFILAGQQRFKFRLLDALLLFLFTRPPRLDLFKDLVVGQPFESRIHASLFALVLELPGVFDLRQEFPNRIDGYPLYCCFLESIAVSLAVVLGEFGRC